MERHGRPLGLSPLKVRQGTSTLEAVACHISRVDGLTGAPGAHSNGGGESSRTLIQVTKWPPHYGVQKPAFFVAISACLVLLFMSLRNAEAAYVELFHIYYQPLIVILSMLWLWGLDVRIFEAQGIRYEVCFSSADQKYLLSSRQLFQAAGAASLMVLASGALFALHLRQGQYGLAALQPPIIYCVLIALLFLPSHIMFKESRLFFGATFWRVATPWREVTWSDFLLADILTSLSKALSDSERALCHLLSGPVLLPHSVDMMCGSASLVIPVGLALPYAWRLCQCIRVFLDTGARPQLFNAVKYSTAFPVILFSALKYHVDDAAWAGFYKPLWLGAALLNSGYSYFWDLERDWEIQLFTAPRDGERVCGMLPKPVLRSELCFGRGVYTYLMLSNLLLRLSWTYKLSPHLRHDYGFVLLFTMLEAFRRFQWVPVRVEVELRKLQAVRPELGQLVPVPAALPGAKPGRAPDAEQL